MPSTGLPTSYTAGSHFGAPASATPRPRRSPKHETSAKTPMPAIVPARGVWTLVLNSQLTIAPAYDATHAYFPLEGDRLAAYLLPAGTLSWVVTAHPLFPPAAG